jgi:tetratricopeptide (TPR) repeat protein
VPANPTAYEFYLRANQVQQQATLASLDAASLARDLYLQSIDADPHYAPAWANLGRCYRVLGKSRGDDADEQSKRAESCLQRALSLNPQLASVTRAYAQLESDTGRSKDALVRLVSAVKTNDRDPELWAGMVHACRYCGLLDESVAAHARAIQLDPAIATSVRHTYWLLGDVERALKASGLFYFEAMVLASLDKTEQALAHLREMERIKRPELMQNFVASLRLLLEGRRAESLAAAEYCIRNFPDPEAVYYMARQLVKLGERARALDVLNGVLDRGFLLSAALARDPWLTPLHREPGFDELRERSRRLEADLAVTFSQMGGPDLVR